MILPKVDVKKILYATDLSENARFAYAYAASLSELYGAPITLMHVLPELSELMDKHIIGYIDAERWEKIKAQHFDEAREALIGKRKDHLAVHDVLQQFSENSTERLSDRVKWIESGKNLKHDCCILDRVAHRPRVIQRRHQRHVVQPHGVEIMGDGEDHVVVIAV